MLLSRSHQGRLNATGVDLLARSHRGRLAAVPIPIPEPDIPGGLVFYAGPDNKTLRREDDEILVIIRAIMGDN